MGYQQKRKEFIYQHMYPKKLSSWFTYHKHLLLGGGDLDDGICQLCGNAVGLLLPLLLGNKK